MSHEKLPHLGRVSAQLAGANRRVNRFVDSLPGVIEHLVLAADRRDWQQVEKLSEKLAIQSAADGNTNLTSAAQDLASAAGTGQDELQMKRNLLKVIGQTNRPPNVRKATGG